MFFFTDFNVKPYSKEELEGYIFNRADLITLDKSASATELLQTQEVSLVNCRKDDLDTSFHSPSDLLYERLDFAFCIENIKDIKLSGNVNTDKSI